MQSISKTSVKSTVDNPEGCVNASQCPLKDSSTQTDKIYPAQKKQSHNEVKVILCDLNFVSTNALQQLSNKKLDTKNNAKIEKENVQINKKYPYAWSEFSKLTYGQPDYWESNRNFMRKFNSNLVICPKRANWINTVKPFSCSDFHSPIVTCEPSVLSSREGQGDLNFIKDDDHIKEFDKEEEDGEVQ